VGMRLKKRKGEKKNKEWWTSVAKSKENPWTPTEYHELKKSESKMGAEKRKGKIGLGGKDARGWRQRLDTTPKCGGSGGDSGVMPADKRLK